MSSESEASERVSAPSEDSVSTSKRRYPPTPASPLTLEIAEMRDAFKAVIANQEMQANLLETVIQAMRETLQEMRDTLEVMQRAIGDQDDQTDKLVDVTDSLIKVTIAQQRMAMQRQ